MPAPGGGRHRWPANYAGILILWDRLFGSFAPEGERVTYGLTTDIDTYNPVRVAFHEYIDLWHDVRRARSWRTRAGLALHRPGWRPAGEPELELDSATRG
ncbi:MAG TPA: hypothetical protein VNT03_01355 [Baekduia sp.]|nr:hypothetical protein [Baekduia sp.]